jgi:hypothetical protein
MSTRRYMHVICDECGGELKYENVTEATARARAREQRWATGTMLVKEEGKPAVLKLDLCPGCRPQ